MDAVSGLEEWDRHSAAETGEEDVRMLGNQAVRGQRGVGEVPEVGRDD